MADEEAIYIERLVTGSLAGGQAVTPVTVLTNTSGESGTWAAVDNSGEKPFRLFPSAAVGASLYVGGESKMTSVQVAVVEALASAAESDFFSFEYWNAGAWTSVPTMMTNAVPPNESYAGEILSVAIDQQIRFGVRSDSGWVTRSLNGSDELYWIRIIVTSALTTILSATLIQGRPAHLAVNGIGEIERFGGAVRRVPWDLNIARPANSSPANQDVYVSDTVNVGRVENRFNDGVVDRTGLNFFIPAGMDTSKGLHVRLDWFSTSGAAGDVRWRFRFATTNVGESVYPSAAAAPPSGPDQVEVVVDQASPEAANTQTSVDVYLPVTDAKGRPSIGIPDLGWITIERTGSDVADTFTGDVALINVTATYVEVFDDNCVGKF